MIGGFEKIVEERIRRAQKEGAFEDLPGMGQPLELADDSHIPEDLRMAHKILKNAGCLPPEIEVKREIQRTEDLLAAMDQAQEKFKLLRKLNFLVLKLNTMRKCPAELDLPQRYAPAVVQRLEKSDRG